MSCQWRPRSAGSWEMTQSNPPSELPSDPITSGSSNPDERSSSPATQSEKSQSFRAVSEAQVGDSLFSQAAQQETEPIPRDIASPIIIPDTESDTNNHTTMKSTNPKPQKPRSKKANAGGLNQDDDEYKESDGSGQDSDSSYVEETSQSRNKKKAPSKSTRGKAASKPRLETEGDIQNASKATKGPKQVAQKSQPPKPKKDAVTKTTSKRPQQANKKLGQPDDAIPNSQPVDAMKQAKPVLPMVRVPKKTFYTKLEDGETTQATQATNTKPKAVRNSGSTSAGKKNSKIRDHVAPESPTGGDDDGSIWDLPGSPEKQDHNPLPEVQTKKRTSPNAPGKAIGPNSKKKRSPVQSGSKQGNIKKSTTRTYGQKGTRLGGSEHFQEQRGHESQRHAQSRQAEIKQRMDQSTVSSNEDVDIVLGSPVDESTHVEEHDDETTNHNQVLPSITEEQVPEVMTTNQVPEINSNMTSMTPMERIPLSPLEDDAQEVLEERLRPPTTTSNNANKQKKEAVTQVISVHRSSDIRKESGQNRGVQSKTTSDVLGNAQVISVDNHPKTSVQDVPHRAGTIKKDGVEQNADPVAHIRSSPPCPRAGFSQRHAYIGDSRKIAVDTNQSRKGPISVEKQHFLPKETEVINQGYATPVGIEPRLNITDLGSPLMLPDAATTGVATLEPNPLQPVSHREQPRLPSRSHVPFNYDMSFPLQMTSDFEMQLRRAQNPPLASRAAYQAPEIKRPVALNHPENYQPRSRAVLSPSSSVKRPIKDAGNVGSQASQLDPRSIDFARRVAQSHKYMNRSQVDERIHGRGDNAPAKQPLWVQSRSAVEDWDAPESLHFKADNLGSFFGGRPPREYEQKQNKQAAKPEYETKWQNAVDAASGGVVDTLHFISTVIFLFNESCHSSC